MGVPFVYPLFLVLLVGLTIFGVARAAMPGRTRGAWIAIAAWFVATLFMTVRDGSGEGVRLNLIPFVVDGPGSALDAVRNFFVFVPLGILLAVIGWRLLVVLGTALAVSLAIEITQYVTDRGRIADVNDLITNVAGAALGWLVVWAIHRAAVNHRARRSSAPETS